MRCAASAICTPSTTREARRELTRRNDGPHPRHMEHRDRADVANPGAPSLETALF